MGIDCCHLSFGFLICELVGIITGFKWLGSISKQGDKKVAERLQAYCMHSYVCACACVRVFVRACLSGIPVT